MTEYVGVEQGADDDSESSDEEFVLVPGPDVLARAQEHDVVEGVAILCVPREVVDPVFVFSKLVQTIEPELVVVGGHVPEAGKAMQVDK